MSQNYTLHQSTKPSSTSFVFIEPLAAIRQNSKMNGIVYYQISLRLQHLYNSLQETFNIINIFPRISKLHNKLEQVNRTAALPGRRHPLLLPLHVGNIKYLGIDTSP